MTDWRIVCSKCRSDVFEAYAKEDDEILRLRCAGCGRSYNTKLKPKKPLSAYEIYEESESGKE